MVTAKQNNTEKKCELIVLKRKKNTPFTDVQSQK